MLLPKPEKPIDLPRSYRLLCLINTTAKLFETIIKDRLEQVVEEGGGLSSEQHVFRKGHSTLTNFDQGISLHI